jgi:hypothetical protein
MVYLNLGPPKRKTPREKEMGRKFMEKNVIKDKRGRSRNSKGHAIEVFL